MDFNFIMNKKLMTGLLALALTGAMVYAAEPTIDYSLELKLTYTGVLYQSTDGVNWTKVEGATSPYYVPVEDAKKMLFCSKDELDQPPTPGDDFTTSLSEGVDLNMNWISPGTFMMGSPEDELGAGGDETLHEVTLTRGYWLGKYEVTQAQYEAIMGTNPSRFKGADQPVESVSWNDAMAFCEKLTEREQAAGRLPFGYGYTLPTEAQWEYACRAGTTTAFNNGTNIETDDQIYGECPNLDPVGWYWCNSDETTHPVGQKQPNDWGLYDMHGNVIEWCLDAKNRYPTTSVVDPVQEDIEPYYAVRGGSYSYYDDGAKYCRSAARSVRLNTSTSISLGFRVALVPVAVSMTIPLRDDVKLDLVWIHPGTFMMGSPEDELGRVDSEVQHEVTLTQGYWLGKYEVTQEQYEAVMGTNPSNQPDQMGKYYGIGNDYPVYYVSWDDAMEFCEKLTEIERAAGHLPFGYEYTLPTGAQWEYACRAGTTTAFNNGKNIPTASQQIKEPCPNLDEVGWYVYNSNSTTHPVGQKQANAWGLYDMHGNVFEWCLDWIGAYPTTAVIDPTGPISGSSHAIRGACWGSRANRCRSAYWSNYPPDYRSNSYGFRVALAPSKNMTIPLAGDVNLDMIWIEPGTFMMGSPEDELGRVDSEVQHEVTLTQGYWLGKYEVTQEQYEAVMGTNPSNQPDQMGKYYGIGNDYPVYYVSWDDAMEFCEKLTEIERAAGHLPFGYEYTLPTGAQWEYACRAGTTTAFNNGKNIPTASQQIKEPCPNLDEVGWYVYNSNSTTHPVGQKQANAWGLYDMHGNVFEWCLDWIGAYPTTAVIDPTGPISGSSHAIRGACWGSRANRCRSAYWSNYPPDYRSNSYGFRVALAPVK